MAGIYTRDQEKAIFAKNRADLSKIQNRARTELYQSQTRTNEGSLPKYEEDYRGRVMQNIKRITFQRDAITEAKKQQKEQQDAARKKLLEETENKIKKQQELRHQLADKKISFEEFNKKMAEINPNYKPEAPITPEKTASYTYTDPVTGEPRKVTDQELEKLLKSKEFREKYYQEIKNPSKLFPSGSQTGRLVYNPETKKYTVSHRLTAEEQRKLGVEKPTMEGNVSGFEDVFEIPAPERPPKEMVSEKPTFTKDLEKPKKEEKPSGLDMGYLQGVLESA